MEEGGRRHVLIYELISRNFLLKGRESNLKYMQGDSNKQGSQVLWIH